MSGRAYGSANSATRTYIGSTLTRRAGDLPYVRVDPQELIWDLPRLRARSKWLARNNPHATCAARDLPAQIVGSGILPDVKSERWFEWSSRRALCDAARRLTFIGLQMLMVRSAMVTGDCFVVRRPRRLDDAAGVIPMRLDVLDGESLSETDSGGLAGVSRGGVVEDGIEYGPAGMPVAYWFRRRRPGWWIEGDWDTYRVPARDVIHLYDPIEPGLRRGVPWMSAAIMPLMQLGQFNDATREAKSTSASVSLVVVDPDANAGPLGGPARADLDNATDLDEDAAAGLQPGAIPHLRPGEDIRSFTPPTNRDLEPFTRLTRQDIASSMGMTPEDMSGDYAGMNFSQAKKSQAVQGRRIWGHRQRWLLPAIQEMELWAREAAESRGEAWPAPSTWTNPALPQIDPEREGNALMRAIRTGLMTVTAAVRERGLDPDAFFAERAAELATFRRLGLVFDSSPGEVTQQGQMQQSAAAGGSAGDGDGMDEASIDRVASVFAHLVENRPELVEEALAGIARGVPAEEGD